VQLIGLPPDTVFQLIMMVVAVYVPVPDIEKFPEKVCAGMVILLFVQLSCAVTGTPYRLLIVIPVGVASMVHG